MIIGRSRIQFKRENINNRIRRSNIFFVNQKYELEPCPAISFEIATQYGQEFSLKICQFIIRALWYDITRLGWNELSIFV